MGHIMPERHYTLDDTSLVRKARAITVRNLLSLVLVWAVWSWTVSQPPTSPLWSILLPLWWTLYNVGSIRAWVTAEFILWDWRHHRDWRRG